MLNIFAEIEKEIRFVFPKNTKFIQGETFAVDGDTVFYRTPADILRAALRLKAGLVEKNTRYEEPCCFDDACFLIDCSRNAVPKVDTIKKIVRIVAMLGYSAVMLYTEDTFEVDNEPVFGYMRGRYTKAELKEMDAYACALGVELIPCIQTLAHFDRLRRWYKEYNAHFDCGDILLVGDARVHKLLENIFDTLAECFTSRRVHIGMDEALSVGRGQYMDIHGYRPFFDTFVEHLQTVSEIAARHGFSCIMWGDTFCSIARRNNGGSYENLSIPPEVIAKMPQNVEVSHWCYDAGGEHYVERYKLYADFGKPTWMALSTHKCLDFLPMNRYAEHEYDVAFDTLAACPYMRRLINCAWSDNGGECSLYAVLPSLTGFACKAYGLDTRVRDRLFYALTDTEYDAFCKMEYANTLCDTVTQDFASPAKLFLYNDVLCGQFDAEITEAYRDAFVETKAAAERLANSKYGILFMNVAAYMDVLLTKFDMSVRVRGAYAARDGAAIAQVVSEIPQTIAAIDRFIETLRAQWFFENKPQGFEIQELRLGGLKERLAGVSKRLQAFLDGKADAIPELEEPLLEDVYLGRSEKTGRLQWSSFALTTSVNAL